MIHPSQANSPSQYDSPEINWASFGSENSPSRIYFKNTIADFLDKDKITRKRILDIGCGTGYMCKWFMSEGAAHVEGFDPAKKSIEIAQEKYPDISFKVATLEGFSQGEEKIFDTAIAIMVFEHVADLHSAFKKINSLLAPGGVFCLIIGDKDFHTFLEKDSKLTEVASIEILNDFGDGTVETKTVRKLHDGSESTMFDMFRPLENVRRAASDNDFKIIKEKTLTSTKRNIPMCYVVLFEKVGNE